MFVTQNYITLLTKKSNIIVGTKRPSLVVRTVPVKKWYETSRTKRPGMNWFWYETSRNYLEPWVKNLPPASAPRDTSLSFTSDFFRMLGNQMYIMIRTHAIPRSPKTEM